MGKKILETAIGVLATMIIGAAIVKLSGYWAGIVAAQEYFIVEGKPITEPRLTKIAEVVENVEARNEEYQEMLMLMQTKVGDCIVISMETSSSAMVSRRSPFKKGAKILIENLSSDGQESATAIVVGDFISREDNLLLKVSPDVGRILSIPEGAVARVEVKPMPTKR